MSDVYCSCKLDIDNEKNAETLPILVIAECVQIDVHKRMASSCPIARSYKPSLAFQ